MVLVLLTIFFSATYYYFIPWLRQVVADSGLA